MPDLKITLDQETYDKLVALSFRDCRPVGFQAEWMLKQTVKRTHSALVPRLQQETDARTAAHQRTRDLMEQLQAVGRGEG